MNHIQSVCVYCGASNTVSELYRQAAQETGKLLAENKFRLVYGGGRMGLMGIAADSAKKAGGTVVGFIPQHLDAHEGAHQGIDELYIVDSMHTRKAKMVENADAFIILPGGFGTLDEFFEILTWSQLNLHQKPILVLNINGYWNPLKALMDHIVKHSFADNEDIEIVHVVNSVSEAIETLKSFGKVDPCFISHLS